MNDGYLLTLHTCISDEFGKHDVPSRRIEYDLAGYLVLGSNSEFV